MRIGRPIRRGAASSYAVAIRPLVMSLAPAAFALGQFASPTQLVGYIALVAGLCGPPLAIRVTVRGAAIADPCTCGKLLVQGAARWTKRAAEKNRHGTEGRTVNVHAGGNSFPRIGAAYHDCAHSVLLNRSLS